jgi:hypothetical protein
MSERESTIRTTLVTYFPMFIAVLSLVTSMYNGYLNNRFLDFIQRNTGRVEYMRTCKEIIDAYFQIKLRASAIAAASERNSTGAHDLLEGENAVAKFAALGTYLANLRDDAIRERYTALSREVGQVIRAASRTKPADLDKSFGTADSLFADLNSDCVKLAKEAPL